MTHRPQERATLASLFVTALFMVACNGGARVSPDPRPGPSGSPCNAASDCLSGECVLTADGGVCSALTPDAGPDARDTSVPDTGLADSGVVDATDGSADSSLEDSAASDSSTDAEAGCPTGLDSRESCGVCGLVCALGESCVERACQCDDVTTPDSCSGVGCVDLASDTSHCGACGTTCRAGETCDAGSCACASGLVCDDACVPDDDDLNCGGCGVVCSAGFVCSDAACVCAAASATICDGTCVATSSDRRHCGGCDIVCLTDQVCNADTCECPGSGTHCAAADGCFDTDSDPGHCGACGNACDTGIGEVCLVGSCKCDIGATFCASQGRCIDVASDSMHCGGCDALCPSGTTCSAGTCVCPDAGEDFCSSAVTCVDFQTNSNHCGACDVVCPADQTCMAGTCACPAGLDLCDAFFMCTDLSNDGMNCGGCFQMCPFAAACISGACICDNPAFTPCFGDACSDHAVDAQNCGGCGNRCSAGMLCEASLCVCPGPTPGTPVRINAVATAADNATIAWNGTHVGVAFDEETNIRFVLALPDGTPVGPGWQIDTPGFSPEEAHAPNILWTGSEWAIAWIFRHEVGGVSRDDVHFRRYQADGTPIGAIVEPTAGRSLRSRFRPELAHSPTSGYYLATTDTGPGEVQEVWVQALGSDGTAPGDGVRVEANASGNMLAMGPGEDLGILYAKRMSEFAFSVRFQRLDASLMPRAAVVAPFGTDEVLPAELRHDGNDFVALAGESRGSIYLLRGTSLTERVVVGQDFSRHRILDETLAVRPGEALAAWRLQDSRIFPTTNLVTRRYTVPASLSASVPLDEDTTHPAPLPAGALIHAAYTYAGVNQIVAAGGGGSGDMYLVQLGLPDCP